MVVRDNRVEDEMMSVFGDNSQERVLGVRLLADLSEQARGA